MNLIYRINRENKEKERERDIENSSGGEKLFIHDGKFVPVKCTCYVLLLFSL